MARKKLLIAALVVGCFAAGLVYLYGQQQQDRVEVYEGEEYTEEVIVAATNIQAGDTLEQGHITTKEVPQQFLPSNPLMRSDVEIYLGRPIGQPVDAGDMILTSDFSVAEDRARTLAGRVPAGERAMTIPVDSISGVAGLLQPGDRVDILGTFPIQDEDELIPEAGGQSQGYMTMPLLQDVTLLAVGQRIGTSEDGRSGGYSSVTLSLTPEESELMIISQTRGDLSLLLRNREDMESIDVNQRTLREVLEDLEVIQEERQERIEERPPPCPHNQRRNASGECVHEIEFIR